jgi:hypothetical protein
MWHTKKHIGAGESNFTRYDNSFVANILTESKISNPTVARSRGNVLRVLWVVYVGEAIGRPYEGRDFCRSMCIDFVGMNGGDTEFDDLDPVSLSVWIPA